MYSIPNGGREGRERRERGGSERGRKVCVCVCVCVRDIKK